MNPMQNFKDELAVSIYGMTAKEAIKQKVCIQCKKSPTFTTGAGVKEYQITGLCEPCFDEITKVFV